uniref:Uncharacterized protein n=1 Tax=Arundo donax TaxID=35708 RepID=A0A0A8ZD46_ARUDO
MHQQRKPRAWVIVRHCQVDTVRLC